jgi:hypothetical protein
MRMAWLENQHRKGVLERLDEEPNIDMHGGVLLLIVTQS